MRARHLRLPEAARALRAKLFFEPCARIKVPDEPDSCVAVSDEAVSEHLMYEPTHLKGKTLFRTTVGLSTVRLNSGSNVTGAL